MELEMGLMGLMSEGEGEGEGRESVVLKKMGMYVWLGGAR